MSVALKAVAWAWRFKETENDSPVHRTLGSQFKSPITLWKFAIDKNGPMTSLIGPRGAD